ncbi:MAG: C10 family peptidase [Bacteroidales bacterium]|nr:C10 family peptidase [Bacteroidales bacterium]
MVKRKLLLSVFCSFFLMQLLAQSNVDRSTAEHVAKKFYFERISALKKLSPESITVVKYRSFEKNGVLVYHVMDFSTGGYVIVAGSNRVQPVLAYDFENRFTDDNSAPNFSAWMAHYESQIIKAEAELILPSQSISEEWQRLANNDLSAINDLSKEKSVLPLISSRWNQGKYYNGMCPEDPAGPDGRTYAGCVATAMGQLMYYHRWPHSGTGSYSYQHDIYGTISSDFENTVFDWESMANSITKPNKAIAELLFNMGVSVDMNYGPDGSGMWNHSAARSMRNYFKYCPETEYIFRDSTTLAWDSILIANLDNKKPLYYAGWTQNILDSSGHAFVCDGYQGFDYFHFDWGWGGSFNGYFYLNQLIPGGSDFNFRQEVIKDIYPDTLNYTYPVHCSGHKVLTEFVGSLEDGSGIQPYQGNADCSWLIAPELFVNSIKLVFDYFETESDSDFVRVYGGQDDTAPLLGEFSGNTLPQDITFNGQKLFVTFTSNDSIGGSGFSATYTGAVPSYCNPLSLVSSETDTLTDGSGLYNYNYATNCRWRIQPLNAESITLKFLQFNLDTNVDVFEVYDMTTTPVTLLDSYTGNQLPVEKTYNSGVIMLWFKTNTYNPQNGWEVVYTSSATSVENRNSDDIVKIYPNPVSDILNIEFMEADVYALKIISINGKSILDLKDEDLQQGIITLNTSEWAKGIYILKIETQQISYNKKIIIY